MSDTQNVFFDEIDAGLTHPGVTSYHDRFIVPYPGHARGFVVRDMTYIKVLEETANGRLHHVYGSEQETSVPNAQALLDSGDAFLPGRDYSIYLTVSGALTVCLSGACICPAEPGRKIGGFHTLCADVGTIANHPLSGLQAGDILPASFWDLLHRPTCDPAGMVHIQELDFWADIYLQSGSGTNTQSVFNGTITDSQSYSRHMEDLFLVGKTPLSDEEFSCAAEGSNQRTIIMGGADPVTTGGHVDTAGRRMISKYGLEDCCGAMWQWISGWSYGSNQTAQYVADGEKGSIYQVNALLAGGDWVHAAHCGSRARIAYNSRLCVSTGIGCRSRASSR